MTETDSRPSATAADPDGGDRDPRVELRSLAGALRRHAERFERMGVYAARGAAAGEGQGEDAATVDVPPAEEGARADRAADHRVALQVVRDDLGECTRCKLSPTRTSIVFGVGAAGADLMFVGEAPGAEEDRRGEPFVGAAGQLLDRMIAAMGWTRDAVYIANVLKCRPPGNRDPEPDEVGQCLPFLRRQIEAIDPRVIVALGRPAAQALLQTTAPISALRGRFHRFGEIPLMPTFHPAYLLRTPERKRDAWSDLKQVIDELERLGVRAPSPPRP
ncbi:MAG TPA: uracil-DNA glycosylase [Kofleriaceae bacterium]|nr:uracil-DNA glycosylase [Kofleriaceae bacterium]